jgi:hypothetical protein
MEILLLSPRTLKNLKKSTNSYARRSQNWRLTSEMPKNSYENLLQSLFLKNPKLKR